MCDAGVKSGYNCARRYRGDEVDVDVKKILRNQILFSAASESVISHAAGVIRFVEYQTRDPIYYQGDPRSPLVMVIKGQLRASTVSEYGVEAPFKVINPGEVAGILAILGRSPSPLNVAAVKTSLIGILNRADARTLLQEPSVSPALNSVLASEFRRIVEQDATQAPSRADSRISALIEASYNVIKESGSGIIELPDQVTIAAMVKVSRETVSRVLKTLERRGMISKEGRRIRVLDSVALHKLATG